MRLLLLLRNRKISVLLAHVASPLSTLPAREQTNVAVFVEIQSRALLSWFLQWILSVCAEAQIVPLLVDRYGMLLHQTIRAVVNSR